MPQRAARQQGAARSRRGAAPPGVPGAGAPALPAALPEPATDDEPMWLEPYPDALLAELPDATPGPEARYEARESISLAFIVALQRLPPRQRATLVLRDALGYRAAEAAQILDCSLDTVNGSLKRARAALSGLLPGDTLAQAPLPGSAAERDVVDRFTDAFERGDVTTLVAMLTDDAWLTMPPWPLGFRGRAAAAGLLSYGGLPRRHPPVPARPHPGQRAAGVRLLLHRRRRAQRRAAATGMIVLSLAGHADRRRHPVPRQRPAPPLRCPGRP